MKRLSFLTVFFLWCSVSFAQNACVYSFSGVVLDDEHSIALPAATITIKELNKVIVSDDKGSFSITDLCAGTYTISIQYIGFEKYDLVIKLDKNIIKNIILRHTGTELHDVEISAERTSEKTTLNKIELRGIDLEKTRGKSLGEALKEIPGVTVLQTGPTISKPVIDGMYNNRILIINNGIRQEGQQWGTEHAPEIDPFIAHKLTVIKGAGSIRYGSDAIGGVVLVEPSPLRDSAGIGGEVNLVGISNGRQGVVSGILEGNFKKISALSWRVQGTFKQAGNIKSPGYYLKNSGMKEYNFSWATGYTRKKFGVDLFYSQFNTDVGIFTGAHIGNLTDLQRAINSSEPLYSSGFLYDIDRPYQHVEHELFKVRSFVRTGDHSKLNIVLARQYNLRDEYDKDKPLNDSLAALNRPELHYEITTYTADVNLDHEWIRNINGTIGVSGMKQDNTYRGRVFIPNFQNYTGAAYLIERLEKGKFEYEAGIRYDYRFLKIYKYTDTGTYSPEHMYQNLSGNAGLIYHYNSWIQLNLNAGSAFRSPSVNELYGTGLHHGEAKFLIADDQLHPEYAYVLIGGIHISDEKRLSGQVDLYYKFIDGYIYLNPKQPATLTIRGAFPTFEYLQTDATFWGADAQVKYRFNSRWNSLHKMNMVRARNSDSKYLPMIPSDRFENGITYKPGNTKHLDNTALSLSALNVLEQTRVEEGSDYKNPPGAYMLFNFDANTFVHIRQEHFEMGASINNILNTRYREYMNAFRYYADEPGRSFTLRIKYHF
jgi:iron complex outermembrane recepter protein